MNGSLFPEWKKTIAREEIPLVVLGVVRWRCLSKRNDTDISDLPDLIAACCVLHNLCEIHRERFNEEWLQRCQHT